MADLNRSNVGYASTCNSVGQTAGYFLGYVLFVAFESADFCNKYLRSVPQPKGLLTLDGNQTVEGGGGRCSYHVKDIQLVFGLIAGFLYFWGITFMLSTTLVWLLKREKLSSSSEPEDDLSIAQTYKLLLKIFRLPTIQLTVVILMTARVSFRQFPPSRPLINQFQFGSFGCRSGSQPTPSPLSNWSKRWISSIHRSSVAFHLIALTEFSGRSQSAIGPAAGASGPSSNHPAVDDQSIHNRTSTHGSLSESYSVQVSIDCVQILADPNRYSQIRKPNCKDFRPVLINPIIRDPYRSLLILRGTQRWGSFLGFFSFFAILFESVTWRIPLTLSGSMGRDPLAAAGKAEDRLAMLCQPMQDLFVVPTVVRKSRIRFHSIYFPNRDPLINDSWGDPSASTIQSNFTNDSLLGILFFRFFSDPFRTGSGLFHGNVIWPCRLMFGLVYAGLVWITPSFQDQDGQFPFYYYLLVLVIYALHQVIYSLTIRFQLSVLLMHPFVVF